MSILSEQKTNEPEGEINEEEIAFVLNMMKNNKNLGSDGFSAEFFKFFFNDLKVYIKKTINDGYHSRIFSIPQRQGLITCIPKGDNSRQYIKIGGQLLY